MFLNNLISKSGLGNFTMTEIRSRVNLLEKNKNKITRQKLRSAFDVFFQSAILQDH